MLFVILLALVLVLGILFFGLFNMVRKTDGVASSKRSQKLMRYRVLAQAGVVLLLLIAAAMSQ
jgi:hypothetical protein